MLFSTKRSQLEVIADVLRAQGSKTTIMYRASLNYEQMLRYLAGLEEMGLMRKIQNGKQLAKYEPTEKGKEFLKMIEALEEFIDNMQRNDQNPSKPPVNA